MSFPAPWAARDFPAAELDQPTIVMIMQTIFYFPSSLRGSQFRSTAVYPFRRSFNRKCHHYSISRSPRRPDTKIRPLASSSPLPIPLGQIRQQDAEISFETSGCSPLRPWQAIGLFHLNANIPALHIGARTQWKKLLEKFVTRFRHGSHICRTTRLDTRQRGQ
jgi:hypothetical protein